MGKTYEIFIKDFKPEKQKEILKFLGIKTPEDGNFDIFPVAYIDKPEDEEMVGI